MSAVSGETLRHAESNGSIVPLTHSIAAGPDSRFMIRSTLSRYLFRRIAGAAVMALAVLLAVTSALFLAELLGQVADGEAASATVFTLLLLRLPEAALLVGPLALMLGVLMTLAQQVQNGEIGVMRASGLAPGRLLLPVGLMAMLWAAALAATSGWLAPWAARESSALADRMAEEILLAGIRPGQFQPVGPGGLSIYVGQADTRTADLERIFIHFPGPEGTDIVSARRGELSTDPASGARLLTLYDGFHLQHSDSSSGLPLRRIRFSRNEIEVPLPSTAPRGDDLGQRPLVDLVGGGVSAGSPEAQRELQWRIAPPLASLLLALLVVPVSVGSPRGGSFGVVVPALVFYLVYSNAINLVLFRASPEGWFGVWVLHAAMVLLVLGGLVWWRRRW